MSTHPVPVSVIVPSHRGDARVRLLLKSLAKQEVSGGFEVHVIANPPEPELEDWIRRLHPDMRYLASHEIGANRARNQGIEHARGEILVFLDDDCILDRTDFLQRHLDLHRAFPDIAGLGGPYRIPAGAGRLDRLYHRIQESWLLSGRTSRTETTCLLGGNCSFKSSIVQDHRFDPALVFGGTETELCLRLTNAGHRLSYQADLSPIHLSGLNINAFIRKSFYQGMGAAYILTKVPRKHHWIHCAPPRNGSDLRFLERMLFWAYDVSFQAGFSFGTTTQDMRPGRWQMIRQLLRECGRRMAKSMKTRILRKILLSIRGALSLDSSWDP